MTAHILSFPSSRCRAVRVERERGDLGAWLTIYDACGNLHGSFADAFRDACDMGAKLNASIQSSAGTFTC